MAQRETQRELENLNTRRKSESTRSKEKRKINRQAMAATIVFSLIFFFMIGYYAYFVVVRSEDVVHNSYNKRIDSNAEQVIRGTIYSRSGKELAYTDTQGTEDDLTDDVRVYPYGKAFAHVIGIKTHGKYGLEKQCNFDLLSTETSALQKIIDDFANNVPKGCDVHTTLSVSMQKAAYESLGEHKGSVVIMDPDTGAINVMTSKPSYDPETIDDIWEDLEKDKDDSRLLNRATQGKYIPGSIFKIVTALEYMRENKKYSDFSYYCNGKADFKGYSIKCFDGNSHYNEDLEKAFAYSCNSAFSTIGDELNITKFRKTAKQLLFNSKLPLDTEYNESYFPLKKKSTQFDITQTSIGQGKTTVTPMHMAMIASAIANDGILMKPYVIDHIENSNGTVVKEHKQKEYKQLMTKKEAEQLKEYMGAVCKYGTGKILAQSGYDSYGKTGTAEIDKQNHINSWFVGYAQKDDKKLAIAVVIENISEGSDSAVNCAKKIFDAHFK